MTLLKACDFFVLLKPLFLFFFFNFLRRELNMIHFGENYIIGCFTVFRTTLIFVLKWHNVRSVGEYLPEKREN